MGASSGIGFACAEALAKRGVKVGVAARRCAALKQLKARYPEFVEYSEIDVTAPAAASQIEELIDRLGGLDIYFHVAGIGYSNPELDPEKEVKIFETNTCGAVRCVCAAYRYFRSHNIRGQIAVLTSVAGTNGLGHLSAYSASKGALQKWLVALEQLSHDTGAGISFTDIRPGWIQTPLLQPGADYPLCMSTEYAVPRILKAIIRRKRVAVIDWRWNIIVGIWRLIPNALYTHLNIPASLPAK